MALSWQSLQVPNLKNMTTVTGGGSFAGLASSGIARLQSTSLYGQAIDWEYDDDFTVNSNQSISFSCPNKFKGTITGYLSDGIKLSGQSEWENVSSNQMVNTVYKLIETADTTQQMGFIPVNRNGKGATTQGSSGISYIQPWASRKFWKGSKPLNLSFNFNLVSFGDGKLDVYDPAVHLLSMCYPRELKDVISAKKAVKNSIIGDALTIDGNLTDSSGKNLVTSVLDSIKPWAIPGPSLQYTADNPEKGDAVTVTIGNLFAFGACYVNQVNLEFSPTFDAQGYPLWCKCSVSFEPSESNYVTADGEFNFGKFSDNANGLGSVLNAIAVTGETLIKDFIAHEKALWRALIS